MRSFRFLFLLLVTSMFINSSCEKDGLFAEFKEEEKGDYANVPEELWAFFERFEKEAAERGLSIDLEEEQISAEIMQITEDGIAGTCTYGSHQPGHIVIDENFWNGAGELYKEMILFHELGHCSLKRDHREDAYSNGACVSIMRSGLGDCLDNYNNTTREAYLDELFEQGD